MKKVLFVILPALLFFTSCKKDLSDGPQPSIDESYWLNQERATVIASDINCPYFVVEAYDGYSVLKSWDGIVPFEGAVLYGNFSSWGVKTFYNRSDRFLQRADVKEYWLSYYNALDEMDYQCE